MNRIKSTVAAIVIAAGFAAPIPASAALVLQLEDSSGGIVTVQDGGVGDLNATAGAVTFLGSVGGWVVNVSTVIGNALTSWFGVDLNSVNVSLPGAGALSVRMTETDLNFGMPAGTVLPINGAIGGTTGGSISYALYADDGNAAFGKTTTLWSGAATGPAFSATGGSYMTTTDPFSMTLEVTMDHRAPGSYNTTSFDFAGSVPEPGTLALFGVALLGLGAAARRCKV